MIDHVNRALLHAELDPVDSVSDTEPWVDDAFDGGHKLVIARGFVVVVERPYWDEELAQVVLLKNEVIHRDAEFQVTEKLYFVKLSLQL